MAKTGQFLPARDMRYGPVSGFHAEKIIFVKNRTLVIIETGHACPDGQRVPEKIAVPFD